MLLQAITIAGPALRRGARRSVDFIKRYIFPGSCIPSVGALDAAIVGVERPARSAHRRGHRPALRDDARALAREPPRAASTEVRALGYSDEFIRMWEFYLCYCEAGFAERALGDVQMLLVRDAGGGRRHRH